MKGDFTRNTFDPDKHFLRVLMQQGRVQLDADWNEQTSLLLHYLQTLAADFIGPHAGPKNNAGFEIQDSGINDFFIGLGRYYVDGILCEVDPIPTEVSLQKIDDGSLAARLTTLPAGKSQFKKGQTVKIQINDKWVITSINKIDIPKKFLSLGLPTEIGGIDFSIPVMLMLPPTYQHQPDFPQPDVLNGDSYYLIYLGEPRKTEHHEIITA